MRVIWWHTQRSREAGEPAYDYLFLRNDNFLEALFFPKTQPQRSKVPPWPYGPTLRMPRPRPVSLLPDALHSTEKSGGGE